MIEITFGESACGSLKAAQSHGKGKYIGGCCSVILIGDNGEAPAKEEIEAARIKYEEQARAEWEAATPMGGSPQDVFGFPLALSIGDISEKDFDSNRQKAIEGLWGIYPENPHYYTEELKVKWQKDLSTVLSRASHGEDIRLWYSVHPDELCGLCWFMAELSKIKDKSGEVYIVKLPEYEYRESTVVRYSAWGEVAPGEWGKYTALAEATTPTFRAACVSQWKDLQKENAPLRASLNGQLLGVPENIYDYLICREIEAENGQFNEAMVIGRIMGKYRVGLGDSWISHRIDKMVARGELEVVKPAPKDHPAYCRILRLSR